MYKIYFFAGELEGNVHYELAHETVHRHEAMDAASRLEMKGKRVMVIHFGQVAYESNFSDMEEIAILEKRIPGTLALLKETVHEMWAQLKTFFPKKPS